MSSELYKAISYTTDIQCLKDCNIYEYDIAKANISVLFDRGLISSFYYNYLYNQDRMVRQVVGRGLRNASGKEKCILYDFVDDLRYSEDKKKL